MRSAGKVRAAGSMNTTISDMSKFAAALVRWRWTECGLARRDDEARPAHYNSLISSAFSSDLPVSEHQGFVRRLGVIFSMVRKGTVSSKAATMARTATHGLHRGGSAVVL